MDIVLKVCVNDGSEILIDGFDKISFFKKMPEASIIQSGYSWRNDQYDELLNNLIEYNFLGIKRNDPVDDMEYRDHAFAYKNSNFTGNEALVLRTNSITTIIDMAKPI